PRPPRRARGPALRPGHGPGGHRRGHRPGPHGRDRPGPGPLLQPALRPGGPRPVAVPPGHRLDRAAGRRLRPAHRRRRRGLLGAALSAEGYDKRWWTLGVLCLSLMVIGVDNTILNVALQWIIDAYTIVFAGLLLTAGSLGDRLGRKGALTFGLVVFGGCSALASQSRSATMLIVCRGLMGIGGAFIFPTT